MGIYIENMEMPSGLAERGFVIRGDGRVRTFSGAVIDYATAIPVPPHGRLIDADAFEYTCKFNYCNGCEDWNGLKCKTCWVDDMLGELEDNAPTIIEAEGEDGRT